MTPSLHQATLLLMLLVGSQPCLTGATGWNTREALHHAAQRAAATDEEAAAVAFLIQVGRLHTRAEASSRFLPDPAVRQHSDSSLTSSAGDASPLSEIRARHVFKLNHGAHTTQITATGGCSGQRACWVLRPGRALGCHQLPLGSSNRVSLSWMLGMGWAQHMPPRDLDEAELTAAFLLAQTRLALEARAASPWARRVPWELFLNDVLPYAVRATQRTAMQKLRIVTLRFGTGRPKTGA
jgi:hypothetical protein